MPEKGPSAQGVVAIIIGNMLEWFDFSIFAFMTPIISSTFFPVDPKIPGSEFNAILATTAIFGAGFLMRPIGAIVLGLYGDRKGRKAALMLVMTLMGLSIALMTFAPSYKSVGILAPVVVLISRLLQGFSVGGEFGPSTAFLVEVAPVGSKGIYGSWQMTGQVGANLLSAGVGVLLTTFFTREQLIAGAWRFAFGVGLIIAPIAIYIRKRLVEGEEFQAMLRARAASSTKRLGIATDLRQNLRRMLLACGMVTASTVSFWVAFAYLQTFASKTLKLPIHQAFIVQTVSALMMLVLVPLSGFMSDRLNRKTILVTSLLGYMVVIYPLYSWLTAAPTMTKLWIVELIVCFFMAMFIGTYCTVFALLFPARSRSTSLSLVNNLTVLVVGGFAQFIVTWLIKVTGSPMAPAYYMLVGVTLGFIATLFLRNDMIAAPAPTSAQASEVRA
jgi:MFS family permease